MGNLFGQRSSTATPAYLLAGPRLGGREAIAGGDGSVFVGGTEVYDATTLNEALAVRPAEVAVAPAAGAIAAQTEQMPAQHVA